MSDIDRDHQHPPSTQTPTGEPAHAEGAAPSAVIARKVARRRAVSLSSLEDSLSGGAAAGGSMAASAPSTHTASDVAEQGFSGTSHEVPHRKEMESSFGADFSGVKAHTDGPARKANESLGAHAYAMGNEVAFKTSNPDKATVAHELTHVLQHNHSPSYKSAGDGSIDTAGEPDAEKVEAAVAAGRPASSVLHQTSLAGIAGAARKVHAGAGPALKAATTGPARKRGPRLEGDGSKFGMGMTFSREKFEKSYEYELWKGAGLEIPIVAVPGLNFILDPDAKVKGSGGAEFAGKNQGNLSLQLGVEGGVGVGLSYGNKALAEIYGKMNAKAFGGFTFNSQAESGGAEGGAHKGAAEGGAHHAPAAGGAEHHEGGAPHEAKSWSLEGSIGLETSFSVGVKICEVLDTSFEFGKVEVGKLTGIYFDKSGFRKDKLGWEWGDKIKEFFSAVSEGLEKAKHLGKAALDEAKKAGRKVYKSGSEAKAWIKKNW